MCFFFHIGLSSVSFEITPQIGGPGHVVMVHEITATGRRARSCCDGARDHQRREREREEWTRPLFYQWSTVIFKGIVICYRRNIMVEIRRRCRFCTRFFNFGTYVSGF